MPDHDRELSFIIGLFGMLRQYDRLTRPDDRSGVFGENSRNLGDLRLAFRGMITVVETYTYDLRRARQRSEKPRVRQRNHLIGGRIFQPFFEALERLFTSLDKVQEGRKTCGFKPEYVIALENPRVRLNRCAGM